MNSVAQAEARTIVPAWSGRTAPKGTVALSAIDVDPADGSALDECLDPASHVFTEHFSTSIW